MNYREGHLERSRGGAWSGDLLRRVGVPSMLRCSFAVPGVGVEPTRPESGPGGLSPLRLPVTPPGRGRTLRRLQFAPLDRGPQRRAGLVGRGPPPGAGPPDPPAQAGRARPPGPPPQAHGHGAPAIGAPPDRSLAAVEARRA